MSDVLFYALPSLQVPATTLSSRRKTCMNFSSPSLARPRHHHSATIFVASFSSVRTSPSLINHGAYGGVPRKVLDAQYNHVRDVESFIQGRIDTHWYHDRLIAVRKRIAAYINAPWEDTVLVDNASNAINVLLSMWKFADDEVLLDFTTAYGPFKAYYDWLNATRGITTVSVPFNFPLDGPEPILDSLKTTLAAIKASGKRPSVCVVSQIASAPAILLPVAEIVALLKSEGVPTIVDGAHALGAMTVDVAALGSPIAWFGNGHKWLYTPKSTCALYVDRAYQTAYYPEPTVVDSFGDEFSHRFVWSGTRDRSAFLAVNDAMDFREDVGGGGAAGEAATMAYVQQLSRDGADLLVKEWGTGMLAPHSMQRTMHNVIVPTNSTDACRKVGSELLNTYKVEVFAITIEPVACYLRVHAQIYLELSDYEMLAKLVTKILSE